ncbi:MAG: right-handed parallel beta-helix repeat-containing protein [Ignavibacteriales bacterium]|nr:right-handed parallel beta-helix repeat-containing protein [Ignavibacteriales bacterium]
MSYGCGVYVDGQLSLPRILNNIIAKNMEGGIACIGWSKARIINNTISDNTLDGIVISYAWPDSIINNIISLNSGYGIKEAAATSDPGKVWYNLFYSNGSGVYYDERRAIRERYGTICSTRTDREFIMMKGQRTTTPLQQ